MKLSVSTVGMGICWPMSKLIVYYIDGFVVRPTYVFDSVSDKSSLSLSLFLSLKKIKPEEVCMACSSARNFKKYLLRSGWD